MSSNQINDTINNAQDPRAAAEPVSFDPPQALIDYTHKRHLLMKKQWKIMDKAEQIKKDIDAVDVDNEDADKINKYMDKIIAIQSKYNSDSDY